MVNYILIVNYTFVIINNVTAITASSGDGALPSITIAVIAIAITFIIRITYTKVVMIITIEIVKSFEK